MPLKPRPFLNQQYDTLSSHARFGWGVLREKGPGKVTFWFIALVIGICAGFAALFFRKGINALQAFLYGTEDVQRLHSYIGSLDWYWVVLIPTFMASGSMALLPTTESYTVFLQTQILF